MTGRGATGRAWVAGALAAAALAAFFPVLSNGFVDFDDGLYVFDNVHVQGGLTWDGIRWAFALPINGETYWHPLTWLSLMLDVQLFGARPAAIHSVNLAIHVAGAVLLYLALDAMTGRPRASALAALAWVVHPLHVEAVAWAVERKTVLSGMLGFAALLAYAAYANRPSGRRMAVVAALLALGMLAKPMLVTLPFLFLILDVWPLGRTRWCEPERLGAGVGALPVRRLVAEKVPLFAVAVLGLGMAVLTSPPPRDEEVALTLRVANAITGYWEYVAKALWPSRLAVFYPQVAAIPLWRVLLAAAGLSVGLWFTVWPRLRAPALVGLLWFLGCLFPMSGVVRGGLWPGMADRFMYLPLAGLVVAAVWSLRGAATSVGARRAVSVVSFALVGAYAVRSNAYARSWRDSETLFRHAVESTDRATLMRVNLGKALEVQGRRDEARALYEEVVSIAPGLPDGYVNLGALAHAAGDLAGAESLYARALQVAPRNGEALYDLGLLRKRSGRTDEARSLFEQAAAAGFRKGTVHVQLGVIHMGAGRVREAESSFRAALECDPGEWRAGYNLASLLATQGRASEAVSLLRRVRPRALMRGEDPAPIDGLIGRLVSRTP